MDYLGKFMFGAVAHAGEGGVGSVQVGVNCSMWVQAAIDGVVWCCESVCVVFK